MLTDLTYLTYLPHLTIDEKVDCEFKCKDFARKLFESLVPPSTLTKYKL